MNQHIQKQIIQKVIKEFESKFMDRGNYVYQVEIKDFLKTSLERVWEEAEKETILRLERKLKKYLIPEKDFMLMDTSNQILAGEHNRKLKDMIDSLKQTT